MSFQIAGTHATKITKTHFIHINFWFGNVYIQAFLATEHHNVKLILQLSSSLKCTEVPN